MDSTELNRIQEESRAVIPTLPVTNIILMGATGRQNKSVKKQVSLEVTSRGVKIPMIFLIATGLPFRSLIGCDILRKHSAIIDLSRGKLTLNMSGTEWTADIIGSMEFPLERTVYHIQRMNNPRYQISSHELEYPTTNDSLWEEKIREIRQFQSTNRTHSPSPDQLEMLINIYYQYRHVFSDLPGKVKNYQCVLNFKEPVNFNRKSYPIAYSLKEAVRTEINQLLKDDIIEYSLSLIHISYTEQSLYQT